MDSATLRRPAALPAAVQLGLIGLLLALAAIGWAVIGDQMGGMDAGPGTGLGSIGWFLALWVVMMAAMMFPSIAPMVVMFVRLQQSQRRRGAELPFGQTALFVGGYLLSWAAVGLGAYLVFHAGRALSGAAFAWDAAGPYVAGGVITAAAAYQLTPLKDVCLRHCRSPLMFLLHHFRSGRSGAVRMGVEHGGYCVGCCWMLMAALFALGVMSLTWMALIAALIALEKLLPWRALANRGIAALLLALGLGVAFSPGSVPGLTVPGSPQAVRAMRAMGMSEGEGAAGGGSAIKARGMNASMREGEAKRRGMSGDSMP